MELLPFGEWLPDLPSFGAGVSDIRNAFPVGGSYIPVRNLAAQTDALSTDVVGAFAARAVDGAGLNFAGTSNALWTLSGTGWADVSGSDGPYSVPADGQWAFAQFGNLVLATNSIDTLQKYDLSLSTAFETVGGEPPLARHIAVVRDFVVLGDVGTDPSRVQWSAFNDPEGWTVGTSQSDFQSLPEGGAVKGIVGGEEGIVFLENAIYMMTATGDDFVFQFDQVEGGRGLAATGSLVKVGRDVFYLSQDGFYHFAGGQSQPIGANKVDRTFFTDVSQQYLHRMTGVADPVNRLIVWAYVSTSSSNGLPDRLIAYNWVTGQWSRTELGLARLVPYLSQGLTLEDLDDVSASLEGLPYSLDSRIWGAGAHVIGAFDLNGKLATFTGPTLAARLETKDFHPNPAGRSFVTTVLPVVEGADPSVALGTRDRIGDSLEYTVSRTSDAGGFIPFDLSARFLRVRVDIDAETDWTHAIGMYLNTIADGVY